MEDLKDALAHMHAQLGELETSARKLANQNFADIIASARGKLAQAHNHPDADKVGEQLHADIDEGRQQALPLDPKVIA